MTLRYSKPVIPGRAEGANPESRGRAGLNWIPGSPLRGAPE